MRSVDPGFRAEGVLVAAIPLSEGTRPEADQWMAFWNEFERRAAAIPGVDAAGLITCAPLSGCHNGQFFDVDAGIPIPDGTNPVVLYRMATAGYFRAMGLRLKEGRFLEDADSRPKAAPAVVVNESFVRTFWGSGASGAGRRIKFRYPNAPWITVVGVVQDVKHYGLDRPMRPGIYTPLVTNPRSMLMAALHTSMPPESLVPAVQEILRQMDPEVPLYRPSSMEGRVRQSTALRAAFSWMLAVFAVLAFVLAVGGAYGVSTYLVTQRTREIGIRVALGARTADIFRSVAATGVGVVLAGVVCGIAASMAVARLMGDALFGVSAYDAGVLSGVAAVLIGTALLANGLPARRAARIDPMRSLRTE